MKMKWIIWSCAILMVWSCKKESTSPYPVLYTLHHIDQFQEGHYLVESPTDISALSNEIGSFGAYKASLKQTVLEGLQIAFDLKEIELQSDDSLRMHFFVDEEEFELTLGYERIDGEIVIDSLTGDLLTYEKDGDQFVVCGETHFALSGPNVVNPGQEYDIYYSDACVPGFTPQDYANAMLNEFTYSPLDTFGIILTKMIYR